MHSGQRGVYVERVTTLTGAFSEKYPKSVTRLSDRSTQTPNQPSAHARATCARLRPELELGVNGLVTLAFSNCGGSVSVTQGWWSNCVILSLAPLCCFCCAADYNPGKGVLLLGRVYRLGYCVRGRVILREREQPRMWTNALLSQTTEMFQTRRDGL